MSNIVIVGANEGIGYHFVKRLLEKKNRVVVLDIKTNNLVKLKEDYEEDLFYLYCDARNVADMKKSINKAFELLGSIDIAVHNACICTFSSMIETEEKVYQDVFNVNYFGALRLVRDVIPFMEANNKGKIIFTSSGVGVTGFGNISPYASSKASIETLAKCLNIEYQNTNISFHIFHPPLTITESSKPLPVPKEFMAKAEDIGVKLAERVDSKKFIICTGVIQAIQMRLCYLFPVTFGKLMNKMTVKYSNRS